jgi:hypothetical protein
MMLSTRLQVLPEIDLYTVLEEEALYTMQC